MSRRRWSAVAAALLLSVSVSDASVWPKWFHLPRSRAGQTAAADPNKTSPLPGAGGKQHVQIQGPPAAVISKGQTKLLKWSATGTTKPVRLSLHNKRPEIAKVNGGDEQTVTTSGGETNVAFLTVTGVNPGEVQIDVEVIDDGDRADPERARQIAEIFRARLLWIADRLEAAARKVAVSDSQTVDPDDVVRLLRSVNADVREVLPQQELAPFRDAVAARLADAEKEVKELSASQQVTSGRTRTAIMLVRNEMSAQSGRIPESSFRSIIAGLVGFFRNLSETSPGDTVCFLTKPENGANILLYPESFPSDRWNVPTASKKWLYLGRYVFEITKPTYLKGSGHMDLLLDSHRVIECGLSRTATVAQACQSVTGTIGRCP